MLSKILVIGISFLFIFSSCIIVIDAADSLSGNNNIYSIGRDAIGSGFLQGNIVMDYDEDDIPSTIRPETGRATIEISVDYFVSGIGSRFLAPYYEDRITMPIEFSIESLPDYIVASVSPGVVYQQISSTSGKYPPRKTYLTVSLKPTAPAFQAQTIVVKAESQTLPGIFGIFNAIQSYENSVSIPIKPGYYENMKYEIKNSVVRLNLSEEAEFPIKITGFNNARTKVQFEIFDKPEGWNASINSEILLGTEALGEDSTGSVSLKIRSPREIEGDNETVKFNVRVRVYAAGHPEVGFGNTTVLNFRATCYSNVEEMSVDYPIIIAIIVICGLLFIVFWQRWKIKSLLVR